jgi:hypothetical protein
LKPKVTWKGATEDASFRWLFLRSGLEQPSHRLDGSEPLVFPSLSADRSVWGKFFLL